MPMQSGYARTVTIEPDLTINHQNLASDEDRPSAIGFIPSPEEITEACRAIQSSWCEEERFWRANGNLDKAKAVAVGRQLASRAKKVGVK